MIINKYDYLTEIVNMEEELSPEEIAEVEAIFNNPTFATRTIEFYNVDEFEKTRLHIVGTEEDFIEYLAENEIIKYTVVEVV